MAKHIEDYYDEIGGYHCDAGGYSPAGSFCEKCNNASCGGCAKAKAEQDSGLNGCIVINKS